MPTTLQTPGVYIVEENAFPTEIVPVPGSVTAFIGYTEKAEFNGRAYWNLPQAINSLTEYETIYGKGPDAVTRFSIVKADAGAVSAPLHPVVELGDQTYTISLQSTAFRLYSSLRLFFANGGSRCYIISVGDYSKQPALADLSSALKYLEKEQEPSILVIPDAVSLAPEDHAAMVQQSLAYCANMQNCVAILDVYDGAVADTEQVESVITQFRNGTGTEGLSYGAAYFPWLVTGIVARAEISFLNFQDDLSVFFEKNDTVAQLLESIATLRLAYAKDSADASLTTPIQEANKTLLAVSKQYYTIVSAALSVLNVLPPSAAMAGIYALLESTYYISKAPANVTLAAVLSPTVNLTDKQQMFLNVDAGGKSVNALRAFPMKGVLAWGAKTLDDNEIFFRYINVRRTLIFIEQSIKLGLSSFVFEPNVTNTWVTVKDTIENFLFTFWKTGGLAGSVPTDAYVVEVGLGSTMSAEDILYGFMRVTVLVAVSHPAEFVEISFQQEMQKS
jgi:hypothetical protein